MITRLTLYRFNEEEGEVPYLVENREESPTKLLEMVAADTHANGEFCYAKAECDLRTEGQWVTQWILTIC